MIDEISAKDATGSSGLAANELTASQVVGAQILATDMAEVGDVGELGSTTWTFQRSVLLGRDGVTPARR